MSSTKFKRYQIEYPDCKIDYLLRQDGSEQYFAPFLKECSEEMSEPLKPCKKLIITEQYLKHHRTAIDEKVPDAYLEYRLFMDLTAKAVLHYNEMLFHGVAFEWMGMSWIFTAPSGTGKTTMFRNCKSAYADDIKLVSGDISLLQFKDDGIWTYSSPWCGKERMKPETDKGRLAGIFFLMQGNENSLVEAAPSEIAYDIFLEIPSMPDTLEDMNLQIDRTEQLITTVPCWRFVNEGNMRSVDVLYDLLSKVALEQKR